MLKKSWITPSWLILLLDLSFAVAAAYLALLLRWNMSLAAFSNSPLQNIVLTVFIVNLFLSLILHTYKGIVRYTNVADIGRVAFLTVAGSLIYSSLDTILFKAGERNTFTLSVILINYFICTFFLLSYRLLVKWLFGYYTQYRHVNKVRTVVYNARYSGLTVCESVSIAPDSNINVVAFLEEEEVHIGKFIGGLPIYKANRYQFRKLIQQEKISQLLIAGPEPAGIHLNELLEECMSLNVSVKKILSVADWLSGKRVM